MRPKQMVQLMNLGAKDRLPVMAEGLELLARNVEGKHADAAHLFKARRKTSANVLNGFACEEAAKALMLLDALRAGWKPDDAVRQLLSRSFYDHHSRLMYAFVYDFPAHLDRTEITELVDQARDAFYVDGPEGFDWIFRNSQLAQREGAMYVDYCIDAAGDGEWTDPSVWGFSGLSEDVLAPSDVIELVRSLSSMGVLTLEGLEAIGRAWRNAPSEIGWQEVRERNLAVLTNLYTAGHLREYTELDKRSVVQNWHMPLLGLDLTEKEVSLAQTSERRDALIKAYIDREYSP